MKYKALTLLMVLLLSLGAWVPKPSASQALPAEQPLDLVIVIDNSGSMTRDDRKLRFTAARMMIDLLSDRDRVGLVLFSTAAQSLTPQLTPLSSTEDRDNLKARLDQSPSGSTNYRSALQEAYNLLESDLGNQRAVIFLTDGQPEPWNEDQLTKLRDFQSRNIPVFLVMLEYQKTPPAILEKVHTGFSATGPLPRYIDSDVEIARAFADVLTQLRPSMYLDVLSGVPERSGLLRYDAQIAAEQKVSEVDFVFVTLSSTTGFDVSVTDQPANTTQQISTEQRYSIVSFRGSGAQPIEGKWIFSARGNHPDTVEAFALIKSDIQFDLAYPSRSANQRVVSENQILPLGVTVHGIVADSVKLEANVRNGTKCELIDHSPGQSLPLSHKGLSPNDTVYWTKVSGMSDHDLVVNVELKQLDLPLRLSRCYLIKSISPRSQQIQILQPTDVDPLEQGGIPVRISLPSEVRWEKVMAFAESPTGRVTLSHLQGDQGEFLGTIADVDTPGPHKVRFLAEGVSTEGYALTFFDETTYEVVGFLSPAESIIDLGQQTSLGEILSGQITLEVGLLHRDAEIGFDLASLHRMEDGLEVDSLQIGVDLCPSPSYEDGKVVCGFEVRPSEELSPGIYQAEIAIRAPEQRLLTDSVLVRFERPQSTIALADQKVSMGSIAGTNRVLSYPLTFTSQLWHGDPLLVERPRLIELRDVNHREVISPESVGFELHRSGSPSDLNYDLVLKVTDKLYPGRYEARVALESPMTNLSVVPSELVVEFDKDVPIVDLRFAESTSMVSERLWGIQFFPSILPFAFDRTAYLHIPVSTNYGSDPPELPNPSVIQLKQGDSVAAIDTVSFAWRNDGPLKDTAQYDYALRVKILKALQPGIWGIRLRFDPPVSGVGTVVNPPEQLVQIKVLGWKAFIWRRLLPSMTVTILLLAVWGNNRPGQAFTLRIEGTYLEWDGKHAMQLALDESDLFILEPSTSDAEVVLRSRNKDEIEIDFLDGLEPIILHRGSSVGAVTFLP